MRRPLWLVSIVLVIVLAVLTSYQLGYNAATAKQAASVAAARPGEVAGSASSQSALSEESSKRFETFWEAWNLVQREFYNKDAIDDQKMTYGAIKGMLDSLGDAHTIFAEPSHAKMTEEEMRGSFDGIGVTVEMKDERLTIVAPLDDSPGARAGLRSHDVIVKVDDKDMSKLTVLEAVALIRGPRGTTVHLTVEREGETEPLQFDIVRAEIKMVTVKGEMKEGGVAYVKIVQFSEPTAGLLQKTLTDLMANKPKAVVLDLRNNPGGLLNSAVDVASQFIGDGIVLHEQRRDAPMETLRARRGGVATTVPIIVLINPGSASASEIVAGAVQDRGRGVLVGEHSFGKDTVQNVHQLNDQSSVRVTIAKWFTPNKQEIGGKGLVPDIAVQMTEDDLKAGRDPQLERALQKAQSGN